jgi:hypothetical protein
MILRFATLLSAFGLLALGPLEARTWAEEGKSAQFSFSALPSDDQVCEWLKAVSPTYQDAYDSIVKRSYVKGIKFKSVPFEPTEFGELGVFFIDGEFEIRLSHKLTGAERVKTLAFEIANAYLNEEHRQIDAGAAEGFFDAREFAVAHEIYEYEAWRVYRQFLLDLEKELGEGALPEGLFYGTPAKKVKDYKLPPLFVFLKHMEESKHMKHYLDWFEKHYSQKRRQDGTAERRNDPK